MRAGVPYFLCSHCQAPPLRTTLLPAGGSFFLVLGSPHPHVSTPPSILMGLGRTAQRPRCLWLLRPASCFPASLLRGQSPEPGLGNRRGRRIFLSVAPLHPGSSSAVCQPPWEGKMAAQPGLAPGGRAGHADGGRSISKTSALPSPHCTPLTWRQSFAHPDDIILSWALAWMDQSGFAIS